MYFVGIDISKFKHDCAIIDDIGDVVTPSWSFTHEPVFAEYYAKKRAEGKPHRVAMTHVAKKLLRVIYTLQTREITYDPDLIR